MSAIFDLDSSNWLEKARSLIVALKFAAKWTESKIDDSFVDMLQTAIETEAVQQIIEWLISKAMTNPEATATGLVAAIPAAMVHNASQQTAGKIGDGKLLELLAKYLPVILAMLK